MYSVFVSQALYLLDTMTTAQEEWKERLRKEWRESMKLPRKKKKQRRKEILLDWSIATYPIFQ